MKNLTPQDFIACMLLVKATRVAGLHGRTGSIAWASPQDMRAAFALYNRYNRKGSAGMGIGCAPCHAKAFNWLLDMATQNVTVEQVGQGPILIDVSVIETS